jgi:hypothetical protein
MDRGADVQLAWSEPPFEQELRAEGSNQRVSNESRDDPAHLEAAGEGSLILAKQALTPHEASSNPYPTYPKRVNRAPPVSRGRIR